MILSVLQLEGERENERRKAQEELERQQQVLTDTRGQLDDAPQELEASLADNGSVRDDFEEPVDDELQVRQACCCTDFV